MVAESPADVGVRCSPLARAPASFLSPCWPGPSGRPHAGLRAEHPCLTPGPGDQVPAPFPSPARVTHSPRPQQAVAWEVAVGVQMGLPCQPLGHAEKGGRAGTLKAVGDSSVRCSL